jgi:hypothetical protein
VVNGTLAITAAVANTSNTAVTWTVNSITNGNATYGTIAGSGLSVTYDAPAAVPSPATFNVTATSVADTTKSASVSVTITAAAAACSDSGNDSLLSGQYAFSLTGFNATGYLAVVGSITVDGSGHITAGEADTNGTLGSLTSAIDTSSSSYSVGSNQLGCATIATTFGTFTTRLALGSIVSSVATEGRMIEWETGSSAFIATGHILQQTASDFSSGLSGSYAVEESGVVSSNGSRLGAVAVISASGGSITTGEMDMNDAGSLINMTLVTGTYTSADTNGRFTMTTNWTSLGTGNAVVYMVSSSQGGLFLSTGPNTPMQGEATPQSVPAGGFTTSSLNGNMVYYGTGLASGGTGGEADFGLFNATGTGSLTVTGYSDDAGTWSTPNPDIFTCTYSVASNGRMTITGGTGCGSGAPVFYLTAANTAFMLGEGSGVQIGQVEPQVVPSGGFTTASFPGTYYAGMIEAVNQLQGTWSGVVTVNSSGDTSITGDSTKTTGQSADQTTTSTITVNSDGTFSASSEPGVIIGIIISSTKGVFTTDSSTYPAMMVMKQ